MRTRIVAALVPFVLMATPVGCKKDEPKADGTQAAPAPEAPPAAPQAPEPPPTEPSAAGSTGPGGAGTGPSGSGTGGETGAGTGTGAPADKPEETKAEPEKVDVGALLKQASSKRTKDDKAVALLEEAEAAGAPAKDLARTANKRGEALYASPDRAKKFFEWAAEKDPKYPDPLFNLAKQAVMTGDVPTTRDYLIKVHERKGSRLLKQVEYDPMWEIVKDDPQVRKLLR